uniref:Uncharacterized protein n=1 Tax=Rousettus aegyptiacus TaxID=9407 RepID=A0A7J8FIN2_ROUAE|nr:hypothetical protein HJG63_011872 [Rousettus aegyptiacus]
MCAILANTRMTVPRRRELPGGPPRSEQHSCHQRSGALPKICAGSQTPRCEWKSQDVCFIKCFCVTAPPCPRPGAAPWEVAGTWAIWQEVGQGVQEPSSKPCGRSVTTQYTAESRWLLSRGWKQFI